MGTMSPRLFWSLTITRMSSTVDSMGSASRPEPLTGVGATGKRLDLTGRDRLVSNVLFNWGAYSIYVIAGFVVPRMIDRRLGQELLGVWDFAWSIVNYFGLVQAGIASSVNRYVARYRVAHDVPGVNSIVSSALCLLGVAGILVFGLTIALSLLLPPLFGGRLGEHVQEAQWVVFFLGTSLAVQVAFSTFSGVLTGCHRWELHNINMSGWYTVTVAAVIAALLLGGGLRVLAAITLVGEIMTDARRVVLAYRVCEGLRLQPTLVRWTTVRKLLVFGGKTLVPSVSNLLLNQTTSILVLIYLGPAALALYARPRSLVQYLNTLVTRMAMVTVPTASSLQSEEDLEGIRQLLLKSVRYSLYLALPITLVLVVFGDVAMELWMGSGYANGLIPAILAVGYLATMAQTPVLMILAGMNAHGRVGAGQLVASLCSVGLNILALAYLKTELIGTAVAVTLPLTILNILYVPFLVCWQVRLEVRRYFLSMLVGPAIHVLPFAVCLVGARLLFSTDPTTGFLAGGAAGSIVLAVVYWRYVLPDRIKGWVLRYVGRGL